MSRLAELTHGGADWSGLRVVVAGIGVSGFAAADALLERGARVVVLDPRQERAQEERGIVLGTLGAAIRLGPDAHELPITDGEPPDLLIVSPGWNAGHPVVAAALAAGVPVWGEAELAWRLRPATGAAPWLTITGTRGKATTATMLAAMLTAGGHRAAATGQAGTSLLEEVLHPSPYEVLAVQLSTFQLRWSSSLRPYAAVCLNVAGSDLEGEATTERGLVYRNAEVACVYNVADPVTEQLVRDAEVIEGCRAIGFTLGVPAVSMVGLVEDVLCDRAFVAERITSAAELGTLDDVRTAGAGVLAGHNTADALAAAALARAFGLAPAAVRDGLRGYLPLPHRLDPVGVLGDVTWIDDSAATDPAAVAAGLTAFDPVVWVADASATGLERVVEAAAGRLRGVVLFAVPAAPPAAAGGSGSSAGSARSGGSGGGEEPALRQALRRHAPDVPVDEVAVADTGTVPVFEVLVSRAGGLARPGDTVLFAPGTGAGALGTLDERGLAYGRVVRDRTAPDSQAD